MPSRLRLLHSLLVVLLLAAAGDAAAQGFSPSAEEEAQLVSVLALAPGRVAGEIGAGAGQLSIRAGAAVSPGGRVFATELGTEKIESLKRAIERSRASNVEVLPAGVNATGLAASCCDAVFMRDVYHHLTAPEDILKDIRRALRPGGRLLVIDFEPRRDLPGVDGVRANRRGHGIPIDVLVDELKAAGFEIQSRDPSWRSDLFAVLARVPSPSPARN